MAEKSEPGNEGTAEQGADEMSETEIDETLKESFPASDPPSWTVGTNHRDESQDDEPGNDGSGEAE